MSEDTTAKLEPVFEGGPTSTSPINQDSPWKRIVGQLFEYLVAHYFPMLYTRVDWSRGYESLDTELARITRRTATGKRIVDKLLKVFLVDGKEVWILVHIEVQGYYDQKFAHRMYTYHTLLNLRFKRQIESMAILIDGNKNFRPQEYQEQGILYQTNFKFGMVKLLDFKGRWNELANDPNPFALVTMAQLKVLELKGRKHDYARLEWKLQLVDLLEKRQLSRDIADFIFDYIDDVVQLPDDLEDVFFDKAIKQEASMPYVNSIERIATRRGREEGRQEGFLLVVLGLLKHRLGSLDSTLEEQISQLSASQLQSLSIALLDFSDKLALKSWLEANVNMGNLTTS